ncbi:PREDICTED: protein NEN1-like [Nelumbo nucifera]|uniref:Protein NEN1-like n=2 Tax=Nelumbo nucifera TaxID=4432 RepID=A0A1U7ZWX9_NELNU|nr:PREDICTED: protein NEN1-like [Nelumbo nucifera]DAD31336.1 TPA_asm: hypothetical protein HUJ06_010187 [Nelumbo nucifera]
MGSREDRPEIVFFDLETTVPSEADKGRCVLEFGAILVCPKTLKELDSYSTFVRPANLSVVPDISRKGLTREAVNSAPTFQEIADRVYDILDGRIWAGHNIVKFDCIRIREAFAEIRRVPPEPKAIVDSLTSLNRTFRNRAGNLKLETLANHFGLGQQRHRSLEDSRLNLEVVKYCAAVLFLESNTVQPENFQMSRATNDQMDIDERPEPDDEVEEIRPVSKFPAAGTPSTPLRILSSDDGFVDPSEVLLDCISASFVPYSGGKKIQVLHRDVQLQLYCAGLRVRFGISRQFAPKLSFVVDPPPILCEVLDVCSGIAQTRHLDSGSSSQWMPTVERESEFSNYPTIRVRLRDNDATEISRREISGNLQKIQFSEFESLLVPRRTLVDAYLSLDTYDYKGFAGIRLVAKRLIIH